MLIESKRSSSGCQSMDIWQGHRSFIFPKTWSSTNGRNITLEHSCMQPYQESNVVAVVGNHCVVNCVGNIETQGGSNVLLAQRPGSCGAQQEISTASLAIVHTSHAPTAIDGVHTRGHDVLRHHISSQSSSQSPARKAGRDANWFQKADIRVHHNSR
jgi:hypothetical protein